MGTRMMRVDWPVPVSLHVHPDVTDPESSQLRRSSGGAVQLLVGTEVAVTVWLQDAAGPISAHPGEILDRVTSIELENATDAESPSTEVDDTVVSTDGIASGHDVSIPTLTRTGNDVGDTILGQPAFVNSDDVDDDTILGQPPVTGLGVEDPDASADTIIGAGRVRPESSAVPAVPVVPVSVPVLPPPLPAIPSVSASAHVNAGVSPTGLSRTRIEAPEVSGSAGGTIAVSFPDGRVVALDRPVYVGRSPKSPRITSGLVPELVSVVSPRREVSSTHLEIQREGRAVVVRDLGSTNGTRVSVPGAATSLLSPGASRVVAPGTLLDLGDDIVLEIVAQGDGASW